MEPHPALVFAASEYKPGLWAIQVAYGTSNLKTEARPNDFRVTNFRAMQYAGLNQATRFDMDLIKWLMWDDDWFASPNDKVYETPIIGSLLEDQQNRLRRLLKRREAKGLPTPFKVVAGE